MRVHDPARDREAEAGSVRLAPRRLTPIEALEHMREVFRRDADPRVRDDHRGPTIVRRHVQAHLPARRGELDGVVQHDQQELPDERRVARDLRFFKRADFHLHVLLLGQSPDGVHGLRGHVVQKQRHPCDRALAGVRARERQQVPHDLAQPGRLALDRLERDRVAARVALLAEGDFGPGAEDRDGRPQLVGGVGHEATHLLHRALDRRSGLPHQQRAATDDEQQGGEGGGPEGFDQRRVLVFELHPIGDRDRDVSGAGRPAEGLGVEP